jgi:hypothetical protein
VIEGRSRRIGKSLEVVDKNTENFFWKVVTRDFGALQPTLEGMKTAKSTGLPGGRVFW